MARRDSRERSAFRETVKDSINEGHSPSFEVLIGNDGKWHSDTMGWRDQDGNLHGFGPRGFHSIEGSDPGWFSTDWDAGHTMSSASGFDLYAIEDRSQNRSDAYLEKQGIILEKDAVEIENLSVNLDLATTMEARGLLDEGTVANAHSLQGWSFESGNIATDQQHQSVEQVSEESTSVEVASEQEHATADDEFDSSAFALTEEVNTGVEQPGTNETSSSAQETSSGETGTTESSSAPEAPALTSGETGPDQGAGTQSETVGDEFDYSAFGIEVEAAEDSALDQEGSPEAAAPEAAPNAAPEGSPEAVAPEAAPDASPEGSPEAATPEAAPDASPEGSPEAATPEAAPDASQEGSPEAATPEAAPDVAPEGSPEAATPEAAPDVAQEVSPEAAAPEAAQEGGEPSDAIEDEFDQSAFDVEVEATEDDDPDQEVDGGDDSEWEDDNWENESDDAMTDIGTETNSDVDTSSDSDQDAADSGGDSDGDGGGGGGDGE